MSGELVISCLARMTRRKPAEIAGHLSLGSLGLSHSFGLSALRAQVESRGRIRLPTITPQMKVDDLIRLVAELAGGATPGIPAIEAPAIPLPPAGEPAPALAGLLGQLGLGMDMQEIAAMPVATDYRTHEFYAAHFTAAEIATAVLRPDPRAHLCGIFCAKEAAKKSHPALLPLRMLDFAVAHDAAGRPRLRLSDALARRHRFEFLISITHTAQFAAATCITHRGAE